VEQVPVEYAAAYTFQTYQGGGGIRAASEL
jgi:hypothetical protein